MGLGHALQLLKEDIAGAMPVLRGPAASAVRRMCGGTSPDHHGHLARVEVELLAFSYCVAECIERGYNNLLPLTLRVFVDDITAHFMVKNKGVVEMAKKVMKKLQEAVEKRASKCHSLRMEREERRR